jgi:xanthine dehydrogenase YagR molybdenum-binding subunit
VPVKLMLDRKEDHLATGNRPSAYAKIRAGVSAEGRLTAFDAQSWGTGGAGAGSNFPLPYIYDFPNRRRAHKDVYINAGQQRAMRAPGHPQGCFLTEILMDELADRVRMDPVAFRIKNLPMTAPNAMWGPYFEEGAKAFGWDKRHPTGDAQAGPIKTGMGCSAHRWGGGGRGSRAHVDIMSDGTVVTKVGTQDLGTGTRTMVAIVTAETLGLPVSAVRPEIGDTNYPFSGASGGSTTAAGLTPAVRWTAGKALDALNGKVGPALGVDPDTLMAVNGRIFVKGNPSKGMAWKDACKLIGTEPISVDGEWGEGLSSTGTSGVQFTEVDVDIETGIVKVKRILTVQDCGLIVSKLTAESQVHGGIIGSLNFALFEDRILDRVTGQMVNPNMEMYLMAAMSDVPKIDVILKNQPERGVIGIGEPPTVSTSAAIANAVRNATGATIRTLPLHPHKILQAIEQERAGGTL